MLADNIQCTDCGVPLRCAKGRTERLENWEPFIRLDIETGGIQHVRICVDCISDIYRIREEDLCQTLTTPAELR